MMIQLPLSVSPHEKNETQFGIEEEEKNNKMSAATCTSTAVNRLFSLAEGYFACGSCVLPPERNVVGCRHPKS